MNPVILLDMDGVIANFVKSALRAHNSTLTPADITEYDMAKILGTSKRQFWKKIEGQSFWENLEPYPWAEDLIRFLETVGPVYICTSPSLDPLCGPGKIAWLRKHFGIHQSNVVLANKKWLLAGPDKILVDDSEPKVDSFKKHGGNAVLFPQYWNSNRRIANYGLDRTKMVYESIKVILDEAANN